MKKIKLGLFPKVLIAIALGSLLGLIAPDVLVRILKTFNVLFAQILKFIVPLLVLGLVTPSVANLGKGAGKMLIAVMVISYLSTVGAGLFSYGCATELFPHYLQVGEISTSAVDGKTFEPYINLKIPPVCDILTALLLSFMVGVGIIFTGANGLKKGFDEFGEIVKLTIEKVIIPLLPFYILTMMCEMSASGKLAAVMGSGVKVIATGVVLSICYLVLQYIIAGVIAGKNPFKCLWNIIPAYLTGFSICSSVAVAYMCGIDISFGLFMNFVLLQAIAAVAAPGVMGGVLMASVGLLESVLGFTPDQCALMMTIYLALDGPACNVSGDAAIALVIDKFFGGKKE